MDADATAGPVTSTAWITASDQRDLVPGNDRDSVTVTVIVPTADLAVSMYISDRIPSGINTIPEDLAPPNEGETFVYVITLANLGPDPASGILLTHWLPSGLTLQISSTTRGSFNPATGEWNVGPLVAGSSVRLSIKVKVDPGTAGKTLVDSVAVVSANETDPVLANNRYALGVTVQAADLALTLTAAPTEPNEGDSVRYRLVVENAGPDDANNVMIADLLPAGLTYQSNAPSQGTYGPDTGLWSVGTVFGGGSATLDLVATVDKGTLGTTMIDTAGVVKADQVDPQPDNNRASASITVPSADLVLTLTTKTSTADVGDTLSFNITVKNEGPSAATGVVIQNALPPGLSYLSDRPTEGAFAPSGRWTIGKVGSGDAVTLDLSVRVGAGTGGLTLTDTAWVAAADQADPKPGNNRAETAVTVLAADLAIASAVAPSTPTEGDTLALTVVVTNNGPDPAPEVTVKEQSTAGASYVLHTVTHGSYDKEHGTWSLGSLSPAASETLVILATVDPGAGGKTIVDTVRVTSPGREDPRADNNVTATALRIRAADVAIQLSADDIAPPEGGRVTFTLVAVNHGPDPATLVRVSHVLPAALIFQSRQTTSGSYDAQARIWALPSLAVSAAETLHIVATVQTGAGGQSVIDSARVAAREADPKPENNLDALNLELGRPLVALSPASPQGSLVLAPGNARTLVLRFPIANRSEVSVTLDAVTLTNRTQGSGTQTELDAEWQSLTLSTAPAAPYGTAGVASSSLTVTTRFTAGKAVFSNLGLAFAPGDSLTLSIQGGASVAARDGDILDLELQGASDVQFSRPVRLSASWPLSPTGSFRVDGMAAAQITVQEAGATQILSGTRHNLSFAALLPANGYAPDVLQKLNVMNEGSARAGSDLTGMDLWLDADGGGSFDPALDYRVGSLKFTGDRWEITGLAVVVPPPGLQIFVTCDVSETATEGRTVRLALPSTPDPALGMQSENDGPLDGVVRASTVQTISTTDRVILTGLPVEPGVTHPGARDLVLLHLQILNSYTASRVLSSLEITNLTSGSGTPAQRDDEMTQVNLRVDGNGNHRLDPPAQDPLLGTTYFRDGKAVFAGLNWNVAPGPAAGLFITVDVSTSSGTDGDVLGLHIADAVAIGFTENTAVAASWPVDSGTRWTLDGMVAAQIANLGAPVATLGPGEGPALALDVIVPRHGYADDVLERIQLANAGTATPADVSDVRLWRDGGDGAFDAGSTDDLDLGPMVFAAGRWTSLPLAEPLGLEGARLFTSITTAGTISDSASIRFQIPMLGIQVQSAHDGPIDTSVTNPNALELSNAALLATLELSPAGSTVGQTVTARLRVRNVGDAGIQSIVPSTPVPSGDGSLVVLAGPSPASLDLAPGADGVFTWSLQSMGAGSVTLRAGATGTEEGSGLPQASSLATSNLHRILLEAQDLDVFATGTMPFAINRGQTQVVPLSLTLANPGGADASDIRLRRLVIRLEDASGQGVVPADVISRIVVNEGTTQYLEKTSLEAAGSTVDLTLARPVQIESGTSSSRQATLSLSLDILPTTTVPSFRVVVDGDASIAAEDANSGTPVAVNLDPSQSYPLRSGLARVVAKATAFNLTAVAGTAVTAGRGQSEVRLLEADLLNPGPSGLGSDVRLVGIAASLIDSSRAAVPHPYRVLKHIKVRVGFQTYVDRDLTAQDDSTFALLFASLLSLPVATPTPLTITATVTDSAELGSYCLRLADPATLDARDANTGLPIPVSYSVRPLDGPPVRIEARAEFLFARRVQELPPILPVGTENAPVLTVVLRHPGPGNSAAIECQSLTLRCRDQFDQPLVPSAFVDRALVLRGGIEVGMVRDPDGTGGSFTIPLSGVVVNPGQTVDLAVRFDVQVTAPTVLFEMHVAAAGIAARDGNLGTPVSIVPEVGAEFPLGSGLTQIQPPARELSAGFADAMPAMLSANDRALPVAALTLRNIAPATSDVITVEHLDLMAADQNFVRQAMGAAVTRLEAWIADTLWAETGTLADTTMTARLAASTPLRLSPEAPVAVEIRVMLREGGAAASLRVGCEAAGIGVRHAESALLSVSILPAGGSTLPFWTAAGRFSAESLRESYSNFPNPFAAGREDTRFVFYLREPARVTLQVWTPRGDKVLTLLEDAPFTGGLHQETVWNGRNGAGDTVRNGAYLAEILATYGDGSHERMLRTVAVLR